MEELWGKLTNLSYEIFGVFVPGAILFLFLTLWWFALGSAPVRYASLPSANATVFESLPDSLLFLAIVLALVYFFGHLLVWISRKHGKPQNGISMRIFRCLHFRIPRSEEHYDAQIEPMMHASAARLGLPIDSDTWRRFYPLAKVILAEKLTHSLVSIYQNKYTLHRSITAAACVLFWLSGIALLFGTLLWFPSWGNWLGMSLLFLGSLVVIWGFSASSDYYWRMWGNTIVTEIFAVFSGEIRRE